MKANNLGFKQYKRVQVVLDSMVHLITKYRNTKDINCNTYQIRRQMSKNRDQ